VRFVTQLLVTKAIETVKPFEMGGSDIGFVKKWLHLGHTLSFDLRDNEDIECSRIQLN
jgi:hypothetical protein